MRITFNKRLSNQESGFTFSELLVLSAVVFGLFVFVLATMARERVGTTEAECLENQRELIGAFLNFAEDHEGLIVPTNVSPEQILKGTFGEERSFSGGGFWPIDDFEWGTRLRDRTAAEARHFIEQSMKRSPLYPYVENPGVFHCPGDFRAQRFEPGQGWAYDSYAKVNGMNGGGWQGSSTERGPQPFFTRFDEVKSPSKSMVLVEEADPRSHNLGTWVVNVAPDPRWVDPLGVFHDDSTVISFADGHLESPRWRDQGLLRASRDSLNGKNSFFFPGGDVNNPDFRWVYEHYRHKKWAPLGANAARVRTP